MLENRCTGPEAWARSDQDILVKRVILCYLEILKIFKAYKVWQADNEKMTTETQSTEYQNIYVLNRILIIKHVILHSYSLYIYRESYIHKNLYSLGNSKFDIFKQLYFITNGLIFKISHQAVPISAADLQGKQPLACWNMKKGSIILEQHFEIGYSTSYVTNINPNEFFLKHRRSLKRIMLKY